MSDTVRITMMGSFLIYINERRVENPVSKSRKGTALMEYLVLHRGQRVPNQQLLNTIWSDHSISNPENALKTLVSRMRTMLNQMSDGMGSCIVSDRGAYHWQSLPNMSIDVLELMDLYDALARQRDDSARRETCRRIMELYRGDLYLTGELEGDAGFAQKLHSDYLAAVYTYIELLRKAEEYGEIIVVCRQALEVDSFDDRLHIELMKAMIGTNRASDALEQYNHAANLSYRYLGQPPSPELTSFYEEMNRSRKSLEYSLDAIRQELNGSTFERGAFVCDYEMFKAIYNLEMRNLERLGTTMFLGIIMIGSHGESGANTLRLDSIENGLVEILRDNLRKGDVISRVSPGVIALLLPTVNYQTGDSVMERIRKLFYQRYPNSDIPFRHSLGMLGKEAFALPAEEETAGE